MKTFELRIPCTFALQGSRTTPAPMDIVLTVQAETAEQAQERFGQRVRNVFSLAYGTIDEGEPFITPGLDVEPGKDV